MEFKFNLNEIFKNDISKVNHTLLPEDFSGDRRDAQHVASQVADIIDSMGVASAKAQDLHHPITSAEKMRSCDHILYFMIDPNDNDGKGSLVGLLKIGEKNLFMYDAMGMVHEKKSLCVLDCYIHESKQRTGLGKKLFDFMLQDRDIEPNKLAIDKPSQSFLSFLNKHYGLAKIYPQNNNFILFEGFFDEKGGVSSLESLEHSYPQETPLEREVRHDLQSASNKQEREDYLPNLHGRHTAFKLPDTMQGMIGDSSTQRNQSTANNWDPQDYLPNLHGHGRHSAFKLQDTMQGIVFGDDSIRTNRSTTDNRD